MERPVPRWQVLFKQPVKCTFFLCVDFIQKQAKQLWEKRENGIIGKCIAGTELKKHQFRSLFHPNVPHNLECKSGQRQKKMCMGMIYKWGR